MTNVRFELKASDARYLKNCSCKSPGISNDFFISKTWQASEMAGAEELLNSNLAISALAYWANFVGVSQATLYDRIEKQIASKQRSMTELPDEKNGCKRNALRACRGQSRLLVCYFDSARQKEQSCNNINLG